MSAVPLCAEKDTCPCLTPVVNDQLWMTRTPLYCRRPDGRIKLPAHATLVNVCLTPSFRTCAGYHDTEVLE